MFCMVPERFAQDDFACEGFPVDLLQISSYRFPTDSWRISKDPSGLPLILLWIPPGVSRILGEFAVDSLPVQIPRSST